MSEVVKPQLPKLPQVGSKEYRELDFKDQLEIKSLQLFSPDVYLSRIGEGGSGAVALSSFPEFNLSYPENPEKRVFEDLPISFLKNYWAGYSCSYREKWYTILRGSRGLTPLDKYGIDSGWMVNVRTFNFSLLTMYPSIRNILRWLAEIMERDEVSTETLLDACKVYAYLSMTPDEELPYRLNDKNEPEIDPVTVYFNSYEMYKGIMNFDEMNGEFPMIEPCEELDYIGWEEFTILNRPRLNKGTYFYPLVPSELYQVQKFRITRWDFVDQ